MVNEKEAEEEVLKDALKFGEELEKEFEKAKAEGIDVEEIIMRPSGRSTSFLNIKKEADAYKIPKRRIIIDKSGQKKVMFL